MAVNTQPKRILIVEDDNLNQRLFKDYLTLFGYQVRTLARGCHFFEQLVQLTSIANIRFSRILELAYLKTLKCCLC